MIKLLNEKIFFPMRRVGLVDRLSPYLSDYDSILDIGASCGRLSSEISENLGGRDFVGVDVHVQDNTAIEIREYDGRHLPFDDNSFDCAMIVDVLHHDLEPEKVLEEAKRVSRKAIVIKDHWWKTRADFNRLKFVDWWGNISYGIRLPYNFIHIDQWPKLFSQLDLEIVDEEIFRFSSLDLCNHLIYKVEIK